MQDITKAKCSSSSIANGTEGRLIDSRDGKVYWVAKLKDGLCWMTQNLDYDGNGTEILVSGTNFSDSTINRSQYYNPGEYIYVKGATTSNCSSNTSSGLGNCTSSDWKRVDVDLLTFAPDKTWVMTDNDDFYTATSYTSTDGKMICTKRHNSWIGDLNSEYIPCRVYNGLQYDIYVQESHYLIGNFYNWSGAANNTTILSGSIDTGVCPNGWKLPIGSNSNSDGSFYKLMNGLKSAQLTIAPYYFVYGGNVSGTSLYSIGNGGYYWSSTVKDASNGYNLYFSGSSISPSLYDSRYLGMSVRCVAR